MNATGRYQINAPSVIHQTIDGEVVVINLDSGHYYSLTESAAGIWAGVEAGRTPSEITAQLHSACADCPPDFPALVNRFIEELRAENLIVKVAHGESAPPGASSKKINSSRKSFVAPELKKFTDMRELLLLDPVHEVGETGWPQARNDASGNHAAR